MPCHCFLEHLSKVFSTGPVSRFHLKFDTITRTEFTQKQEISNIVSSGYRYAHAAQDLATANKAFAPEIPRAPYSFHGSCVVMALLKVWVDSKNMGEDHVLDTTRWVENRALLHYFRQDTELWSLDWRPARPPLLSSLMCPQ